jgi:GNAT superfamily N-acetyltransferase
MPIVTSVDIVKESASELPQYATVPSTYWTHNIFDVEVDDKRAGAFRLRERRLTTPFHKDYDSSDSQGPASWSQRFDTSCWAFFGAYHSRKRIGGAAALMNTREMGLLGGRPDIAVLWDIRVDPTLRRGRVGAGLLAAVERWARDLEAVGLVAETQNVNFAACRFYEKSGFYLREVDAHAYPTLPNEVQLIWFRPIR